MTTFSQPTCKEKKNHRTFVCCLSNDDDDANNTWWQCVSKTKKMGEQKTKELNLKESFVLKVCSYEQTTRASCRAK